MLCLLSASTAQNVGTYQAEQSPNLTTYKCTLAGGCTPSATAVVLDANWRCEQQCIRNSSAILTPHSAPRWTHTTEVGKYDNCYDNEKGWDPTLCPNASACYANCAIEGVSAADYADNYGVHAANASLTLDFTHGPNASAASLASARTYLLAEDRASYELLKLKNREISFDVDVSTLPCGVNGALYLVTMDADGGMARHPQNKAGAALGTGYCDAQCPQDVHFVDGLPNSAGWAGGKGGAGSCCAEMDLWEANMHTTALTPHPCAATATAATKCDGATNCSGVCDSAGCDVQPFRNGAPDFYGPGDLFDLDTSRPFTVTTAFATADGTDAGPLASIRRHYTQDGRVLATPPVTFPNATASFPDLTDGYCAAEAAAFDVVNASFARLGGLGGIDAALTQGMALVFSVWDDNATHMLWLDGEEFPLNSTKPGVHRGPCPVASGDPADVEHRYAPRSVYASFSDVRVGEIGSTDLPVAPTEATPTAATPTAATPAAVAGSTWTKWLSLVLGRAVA